MTDVYIAGSKLQLFVKWDVSRTNEQISLAYWDSQIIYNVGKYDTQVLLSVNFAIV